MKKSILIVFLFAAMAACKNETNKETLPEEATAVNEEIGTFRGEFILVQDGAVLKGTDFIYGVEVDDMAKELADRISAAQTSEFDMVPVVVQGTVKPRPEDMEEGWEEILTITEILYVSNTASEADIKIEEKE